MPPPGAADGAGRLFFWRKVSMSQLQPTMRAPEIEAYYERILTLFFAGRLPRFNHTRHIAVANILRHLPHGRELMHLGLQITATRAGAPEKYSREITDNYWRQLNDGLPELIEFADVFEEEL
jgi:hypothetical protein